LTLAFNLWTFRICCNMLKDALNRDNVALLELAIFFAIFLDSIVSQLSVKLFFLCKVNIKFLVLCTTCPYVRLFEKVDFSVSWVVEDPCSNIKLSSLVKSWLLDKFLNNEGKILNPLLLFFLCLSNVALVILVVGLEDWCLVSGPSPDTIMSTHNVSKLIKTLEYMNSNSSIESCRFKKPKVKLVVTAVWDFVWRFSRLFFWLLILV